MDDVLDACAFEIREPPVGKGDAVLDLVEIIGQQVLAEAPGSAAHGPGAAGLFVKADAKAKTFLPQIAFARRVHHMGVFLAVGHHLLDQGDGFGDEVLVFHGVQREIHVRHRADLTRPEAAGVHHMLGMDGALVGDDIPCPVGALVRFPHHAVSFDGSPTHPRGLGIGMGGARGVQMPV